MSEKIVEKLVKAWNSGNVASIGELYARDAVMRHPLVPAPLRGREAVQQFEGGMFSAFSQFTWKANGVVARGDQLALEFEVSATNTSPLQTPKGQVPATGKRLTLQGMSYLRLNDRGEIAEERRYFDSGSMFVQLGLAG